MSANISRVASLLVVLLAACGGNTITSSDASADKAVDADDRTEPRDDGPSAVCFVDFPCFPGQRFACTGATTYRAVETHDCTFHCPQPCSGGSCDPTGPTLNCPPDTRCIDLRPGVMDARPMPCEAVDAGADASADVSADATTCPLPASAADCTTDEECGSIARGCYCGAQPVEGVNRRSADAAAVCEGRSAASCALGCAVFPGQRAQDGQTVVDGGVVAVRCARDGGVGRCTTYARP